MSRQLSGFSAWLVQRISALYLAFFLLLLFYRLLLHPVADFQQWQDWVFHPFISSLFLLFFLSLLLHAWVGIRDVIIDYVHPFAIRMTMLVLFALTLVGLGVWILRIMIGVQG